MIVPVIPWNPVILLLRNLATKRWHPILFWECPPPSGNLGDCLRWKSKGHHTEGFVNRQDAVQAAMELCEQQHRDKVGGAVYYKLDADIEWSGEETPAMVESFILPRLNRFVPDAAGA